MRRVSYIVPLLLVVVISSSTGVVCKLVPGLQTCSRNVPNLNECMIKKLTIAVRLLAKGAPSMGLLPFDPLHADEIIIDDTGSTRQVATNLRMKNINYIGMATGRITSAEKSHERIFERKLEGAYEGHESTTDSSYRNIHLKLFDYTVR
ncbi:hypothetical protein B566_EDAN009327 [Ephemera danica]|nr:hypothetical protein B566_EDAN009327 [Ephemera danica]